MKFIKLWGPVAAWAGLIFYLSGIPDLKTNLEYDFMLRKIAHILEYLILTFFLYRAFRGSFKINPLRLFIYPVFLSSLYAISDEVHQYFVPGRMCAFNDVLIDAIGILGFYIIIKIFAKRHDYIFTKGLKAEKCEF